MGTFVKPKNKRAKYMTYCVHCGHMIVRMPSKDPFAPDGFYHIKDTDGDGVADAWAARCPSIAKGFDPVAKKWIISENPPDEAD